MNFNFCPVRKAIPALAVGIAFLLLGCQPKKVMERPTKREIVQDPLATAEQDFHAGNYDKALEEYEHYLKQSPKGENSRKALYRMARIYYNKDLYDKALALFKRISKEYPDHPQLDIVKYDIASAYYRLGDYQISNTEASEWIKRYPDNLLMGEVLFLMGRNFRGIGNPPKALYWWLKAAGEFDDSSKRRGEIADRIMGLIKNSRIDELKEMAEYAAGSEYAPHIYHKMASLYLGDNNLDEARDAAIALVRSTWEQYWVSIGRQILDRIEQELSVKREGIGCLLPLSGPFAIYGQEVLNGIELGVGLFNRSEGDHNLELIIKDTKGKTEDAVLGVEELANREKVMAIIGPLASKTALAAAGKAQELGIPIITLTQKAGITAEGDMIFRNFLTPSKEIKKLLDQAMNEWELKRFGILYPDNSYGQFFMNLFWDAVEERGGSITAVEAYGPDETDFAVEIKKMVGLYYPRPASVTQMLRERKKPESEKGREGGPDSEEEPEPIVDFDAVFIPDNYQRVALIAPQFPFYNIFNVRFLGTSLWESTELIEMTGKYIQGAIFPSGFFAKSESDNTKEFVELYKESFESDPGILAANGYDTIRFLINLMDKGAIRTRKDFHENLLSYDNYYGVTGKISFDHQGEVVKDPILLTVSGRLLHILP